MEYPKGAIQSIEEFQSLFKDGRGVVWEASRAFRSCQKQQVSGNIITKKYPNGDEYVGYEIITDCGERDSSCLDMHLLEQDYNDWFLFNNEADAIAHQQGK